MNTQQEIEGKVSSRHEEGAWSAIHGTWQSLHGNLARDGISVEWHDFRVDRDLDWGRSFHPVSLEICLNFLGHGRIGQAATEQKIGPNQVAVYTTQARGMRAFRNAGSLHRFLTLELSPQFLRPQFADMLDRLKLPVRRFIEEGIDAPAHVEVTALPASLLASRIQFVEPPVPEPARGTWYLGRVLEILAQTIFPAEDPQELFCRRIKGLIALASSELVIFWSEIWKILLPSRCSRRNSAAVRFILAESSLTKPVSALEFCG